jgi:DNA polymerase I-like protein with 3'-5' exonuclease and polymerase domains
MLAEVDYSGAEVRCAACYNRDPQLIKYITDLTTDMHRDIGADIYQFPVDFLIKHKDWAKKRVRDWAKNRFVFPEFYGAVWFQRAPELWRVAMQDQSEIPEMGITLKQYLAKKGLKELGTCEAGVDPEPGTFAAHVKQVEKKMWNTRFPVFTKWKKDWYNQYLENGYIKYLSGFVCAGNFLRNEVLNLAIQGTAFHWLLWSLVQIHRWLRKEQFKTRIVGQIHDSIIADVYPPELDAFLVKCKEVMTQDIVEHWPWIIVPLGIEADLTPINGSWYTKKEFKF